MIKRILLVEDCPVTRKIMLAMLKGLNINCYSVRTGEEAVELADYFDLILMDIELPGIDGWEACRRIRRREKLKRQEPVPIIAVTGAHDDRLESARAGMSDHFRKPILTPDLIKITKDWLPDDAARTTAGQVPV